MLECLENFCKFDEVVEEKDLLTILKILNYRKMKYMILYIKHLKMALLQSSTIC